MTNKVDTRGRHPNSLANLKVPKQDGRETEILRLRLRKDVMRWFRSLTPEERTTLVEETYDAR